MKVIDFSLAFVGVGGGWAGCACGAALKHRGTRQQLELHVHVFFPLLRMEKQELKLQLIGIQAGGT